MDYTEKTIGSETLFKGKILTLQKDRVLLPDGNPAEREVVRHGGGCCIAALDAQQNILLVQQFRYPYDRVLLEIPAGKLDAGEDPERCAKRELIEETGASAKIVRYAGEIFPTPGYSNEVIHLFFAEDLTFGDASPDEGEFISCQRVPLQEAYQMVIDNKIKDAKTCIAILRLCAIAGTL